MKQLLEKKKSILVDKRGLSVVGGGAVAYDYILDRFTGTNGALLSAHPLETGEAWTKRGTYEFVIASNGVIPAGAAGGDSGHVSRNSVPLKTEWIDNFTVEAMFTTNNQSGCHLGFLARYVDEQNYLKIITLGSASNGLRIIGVSEGVETLLAFGNPTYSNGTAYKFRVSVVGNVITATWDTTTVTYTSTLHAGTGFLALTATFEYLFNDRIDDFLIWEGNGDPPVNPLYP